MKGLYRSQQLWIFVVKCSLVLFLSVHVEVVQITIKNLSSKEGARPAQLVEHVNLDLGVQALC